METQFEITKGKIETVIGIENIVEVMHDEGIESTKLNDGRTIRVYGNGTYEMSEAIEHAKAGGKVVIE